MDCRPTAAVSQHLCQGEQARQPLDKKKYKSLILVLFLFYTYTLKQIHTNITHAKSGLDEFFLIFGKILCSYIKILLFCFYCLYINNFLQLFLLFKMIFVFFLSLPPFTKLFSTYNCHKNFSKNIFMAASQKNFLC